MVASQPRTNTLRVDVVSDTHGYLSEELLEALEGADAIMHAGDMCSALDYDRLAMIAPLYMCLGNNDWSFEYQQEFRQNEYVRLGGLRWELCHYREKLTLEDVDIAICGHTHRPFVERIPQGVLVMNPGSPTYPRTNQGPTFGRILVEDGVVTSATIIPLEKKNAKPAWRW